MEVEEIIEEDISTLTVEDILSENLETNKLVLLNDDVNSFEHVIYCLCKHLKMDALQAEQVALIVHTKHRCIIKEGSVEELEPYYTILCEELLLVEIQ